jgi:hypothetical protein
MNNTPSSTTISIGTAAIRALNDAFRQSFIGGSVMLTPGIAGLSLDRQRTILAAIRAFDQFDTDNDPYGEHDFGALTNGGDKVFFKIDYYDQRLESGSADPADPTVTRRVLTIMLAEEY